MVFVRKEKVKGHEYLYLVKSLWVEGKGPRQKTIKYLGKADSDSQLLAGFPSKQYYEKVAQETGFRLDKLEIVYRINNLLYEMNKRGVMSKFVMRGGTALNLIYFNIPRLSVDIDLNYIGHLDREKAIKDKEVIRKKLFEIGRSLGYEPKLAKTYSQDRFEFYYKNIYGQKAHIKVEVNYMNRVPVLPVKRRVLTTPFKDAPKARVKVYCPEELFGSKLAALVDRAYPRDIFDAYLLSKSIRRFDARLIRKCFVFYASLRKNYPEWNRKITLTERSYSNYVKPLLGAQKPRRVDVVNGAQKVLNKILMLTKGEREYIRNLWAGKCVPSLLFRRGEANRNLMLHPTVLQVIHYVDKGRKSRSGQ
ncbi:MAG: nucleotidyl transferase AbiEii/AbiGii toxin family protein [Candidatus Diapherotrites archaeon]|nr:nucleotidyl transferase AbiEii/AbiGii toxin family protein [Candidatus Diapherotrites archaeon]